MRKNIHYVGETDQAYIVKENLPFPFVHYPGIVGPFIGFSMEPDDEIAFCECFYPTFKNYIDARLLCGTHISNCLAEKNFILSSSAFPFDFVSKLIIDKVPEGPNIMSHIHFESKLCHCCNRQMPKPKLNFSGISAFERKYGWYVKKAKYDMGFLESILLPSCPKDLKKEIEEVWNISGIATEYRENYDWENARIFQNLASRKYRVIHNRIENEVRVSFGYKAIGEFWTNETHLFGAISEMFKPHKVLFHYKPEFLNGLELDMYVEDLRLGIEYQGVQHFKPIKHWGGENALRKQQERDLRKKELCSKNSVTIIYFSYEDILTDQLIKERLNKWL